MSPEHNMALLHLHTGHRTQPENVTPLCCNPPNFLQSRLSSTLTASSVPHAILYLFLLVISHSP